MSMNNLVIETIQVLQEAREKINSIAFPSPAIEEIPNNIYPPSEIITEDIYISNSLKDLAKPINLYSSRRLQTI